MYFLHLKFVIQFLIIVFRDDINSHLVLKLALRSKTLIDTVKRTLIDTIKDLLEC